MTAIRCKQGHILGEKEDHHTAIFYRTSIVDGQRGDVAVTVLGGSFKCACSLCGEIVESPPEDAFVSLNEVVNRR